MLDEALAHLAPRPGGVYLDGTVGGGGHAEAVLERIAPGGRLIGIDRDPAALEAARRRLERFGGAVTLLHGRFSHVDRLAPPPLLFDGCLLDVGVSSYQLDAAKRGFSYGSDEPLDMRMDPTQGPSAADLLATASEDELRRIIWEYGEERWAARIAAQIVRRRVVGPLERTSDLVEAVRAAIPKAARRRGPHPARRTFQALRIAVNGELEEIREALPRLADRLKIGGRLVVITFHSLEDRLVKHAFRSLTKPCRCPSEWAVCRCDRKPAFRVLTKKPVRPSQEETAQNRRARSAKLRAIERVLAAKESE